MSEVMTFVGSPDTWPSCYLCSRLRQKSRRASKLMTHVGSDDVHRKSRHLALLLPLPVLVSEVPTYVGTDDVSEVMTCVRTDDTSELMTCVGTDDVGWFLCRLLTKVNSVFSVCRKSRDPRRNFRRRSERLVFSFLYK